MKNVFTNTRSLFTLMLLLVFVGSTSWQTRPKSKMQAVHFTSDTTKPQQPANGKNEPRIDDLDQAMKELEEAMKKLEVEMKKIDVEKVQKEMQEAMAKIDMKKLQEEIKTAMSKVDFNKIREQVNKSLAEAEIEMKKMDFSQLEKEMAELQKNLQQQRLDLKIDHEKINRQMQEEMKKAKDGLQKAKEELKQIQAFTDELQKDGLIDKKKGYKIEVKDGELYINGTKQAKATSDKYRRFYKKDNFTINMNGDSIVEL